MTPIGYCAHVAEGRIPPRRGEVAAFCAAGLHLQDGSEVPADVIVLALGAGSPIFPYRPASARARCCATWA